jgi:hypothetical protein
MSEENLGPLPDATRTLAVRAGNRHWFYTHEHDAHGEGVYSAGQVVAYTLAEVQRAVAAERERCAALVQANADACTPGSMLQVCLASNAAAIRQDPDASPPSPPPEQTPASASTTPQD